MDAKMSVIDGWGRKEISPSFPREKFEYHGSRTADEVSAFMIEQIGKYMQHTLVYMLDLFDRDMTIIGESYWIASYNPIGFMKMTRTEEGCKSENDLSGRARLYTRLRCNYDGGKDGNN